MSGGVLSFDQARRMGWAYATPACFQAWQDRIALEGPVGVPEGLQWGNFDVGEHLSHQQQYVILFAWLRRKVRECAPRVVVFEEPLMRHRNRANQRTNIGYAAMIELVVGLEAPKALLHEAPNGSVKKHFTGKGGGKWEVGPDGQKISRLVLACQARGWPTHDDNEADALAILDYEIFNLKRR